MQDVIVAITPHELMRMKAIGMDADRDGALDFVRELLGRVEAESNSRLKCHLDT